MVVRRLAGLVVVAFVVVVAAFVMVRLIPGDPLAGENVTTDQLARLRHLYGLDESLLVQFRDYLSGLLHGDLGQSFRSRQPVAELIGQRAGPSLELAGAALALVLLVGVPLGIVAAALTRDGRHRRLDVAFTGVTSVLGSVPSYFTATVLAFLFAVELRLFPVAGSSGLDSLVLPAISVCLAPLMTLARIVRVETLDVLAQDYIRTARSQRLPARLIYARHAFPNVLTAALTVSGVIFAEVIAGAVIVENVFARAGLGAALVDAVLAKDFYVIQGIALVLGVVVVVVNTLVDMLLAFVDPRSLAKEG